MRVRLARLTIALDDGRSVSGIAPVAFLAG